MGGVLGETTETASAAADDDNGVALSVPTTDDLFAVLANRRRRYTLHYLKGKSDAIEIGTLAEQIAAWENEVSVARITSSQRKRVYTALQQSHLPKMDTAGLLSFDKDRGLITPDPVIEEFDVYVDLVGSADIPWGEFYLALSMISAALLAVVWLGAYPFSLLSPLVWAVLIVAVFCLSSIVHLHRKRAVGAGERPPEIDRR